MHRSHSPAIEEFVRVYWHTLELIIRPTAGAAHHNGFFDVDEGVLSTGVISTLKFVAMLQK